MLGMSNIQTISRFPKFFASKIALFIKKNTHTVILVAMLTNLCVSNTLPDAAFLHDFFSTCGATFLRLKGEPRWWVHSFGGWWQSYLVGKLNSSRGRPEQRLLLRSIHCISETHSRCVLHLVLACGHWLCIGQLSICAFGVPLCSSQVPVLDFQTKQAA